MQKENSNPSPEVHQYVGPYRLEKTLGKGQTGEIFLPCILKLIKKFVAKKLSKI